MRTETDPTETPREWKPFGEKVTPSNPDRDEWTPVPDAPGVEISYKTGMRRTNVRVPNAWVEDLAMQAKDEPEKSYSNPVITPEYLAELSEKHIASQVFYFTKELREQIGFSNVVRPNPPKLDSWASFMIDYHSLENYGGE